MSNMKGSQSYRGTHRVTQKTYGMHAPEVMATVKLYCVLLLRLNPILMVGREWQPQVRA